MSDRKPAAPRRTFSVIAFSAAMLGVTLLAVIGIWGVRVAGVGSMTTGAAEWEPVSGEDADYAARSARVAFTDTQEFWTRQFRTELRQPFRAAQLVYFTAATPTPCAGAENAAGPFYCYITETVALDLTFLDLIGSRLFYRGEAGAALMVARISAGHVQSQLGALAEWRRASRSATGAQNRSLDLALALQADCLTGVWAHHAAEWIAAVESSFYGQLIFSAREVNRGRPHNSVEADPALLRPGTEEERAEAFGKGRDAGAISACL